MLYLVEDYAVAAENTQKYLNLFETKYLPHAKKRGMQLVACWHTPADIGEDVRITVIWSVKDWKHWDQLRLALVTDPTSEALIQEVKPFWKGGSRKFCVPAGFSPMK